MKTHASIGMLVLSALALAACKDKDDKPSAATRPSAASMEAAGQHGGMGAQTPSAGRGSPPPIIVTPVPCGPTLCRLEGPPVDGFELQMQCCVDADAGQCGWMPPAGGECTPPPKVVAACPAYSSGQLGCCIEEQNRCGIDGSMYGVGCYDLVSSPFAADIPDLVARTCDGKPVGLPSEDGGIDAGAGIESDAGSADDAGSSSPDAGSH